MVKPVTRKSSNKSPPIFSHEFIIQNHADIVSCIAMVFIMGLMLQATAPIASLFITLQHNVTEPVAGEPMLYMTGPFDFCTIFFYSLICIVIHAIIQEYFIDKISKRLHLSKSKLAVFSQNGQLAVYYFIASLWGLDILFREGYIFQPTLLWANYPASLSLQLKLLLLIQLAYSFHELPELYFQRISRSQILGKATKSIVSFIFVGALYFLNFNRLLLCLLVLHYISELVFHIAQLIQTVDKEEKLSGVSSLASNTVLVLARLGSIVVAVLTLWYGLALENNTQTDLPGNYNTPLVRIGTLGAIVLLQVYLMFNFITQHFAKARENALSKPQPPAKVGKQPKDKKKDVSEKRGSVDESDLPEVDQNTDKKLRNRAQKLK